MSQHAFGPRTVAATLFASLFASQAVLIAVTPTLADVARDLDVTTAAAGQLRTVIGITAAVVAFGAGALMQRYDLRTLLLAGLTTLGTGALAGGLAPSFSLLAAAHVLIGVGIALVLAAGTAAVAEWAPAEHRSSVLSWAITGQPCAWILGMPLLGLVGEASWRLGFLTLPLAAAVVGAFAVRRAPARPPAAAPGAGLRAALVDPLTRRWAAGELLANGGWSGTLIFVGALLTESYGMRVGVAGVLLAGIAAVYVGGTFAFRRYAEQDGRTRLVALAVALAVVVPLLGAVRPAPVVTAAILGVAAFLAGGRVMLGNAFGLAGEPGQRASLMGLRSATAQLGYFLGATVGGAALAAGGYPALGMALGALFAGAAAALLWPHAERASVTVEAT
jgi:predicted MFS family arabinose efflux permease